MKEYDIPLESSFVGASALETTCLKTLLDEKLSGLNTQQIKAIQTTEGPILILAGAGTGKTTVLTTKLFYLMVEKQCPLHHFLAVTFTNKAAGQMKERLAELLGQSTLQAPWIGTFHHICVKILRRHAQEAGLPGRFTILDQDDQLRLMKQVIKNQGKNEKEYPARLALWCVGRLKDRALLPHQVTDTEWKKIISDPSKVSAYQDFYQNYQAALRSSGSLDFGDLILECVDLFRKNTALLSHYQNHFRYILVDEYQDSNVAQYLWLKLLAGKNQNICCVGDEDQSIYGWRGAEVDHILRFEQDFPGTTVIKLEDNYRSTGHILKAASTLIAFNKSRLGKTLKAATQAQGERVSVHGLSDARAEAAFMAQKIHALLKNNHAPRTIAVLVRATFQTREIEEGFLNRAIPYRLVGTTRFYDRLEIKDALAYARFLVNPNDNLALERILDAPKRGIGLATLQKLHQEARTVGCSLWTCIEKVVHGNQKNFLLQQAHQEPLVKGAALKKLTAFLEETESLKQQAQNQPPAEALMGALDKAGYLNFWKNNPATESQGRLENLKELGRFLQDFETLDDFLEHTALVTENQGAESDGVSIMTLHAAKGLEFPCVFLAGWEEGLFPHPKALDESGLKGLEEERRLAYVGLTRAQEKVFITFAHSRFLFGHWQRTLPSRFLDELKDSNALNTPAVSMPYQKKNPLFPTYKKYSDQDLGTNFTKKTNKFKPGDRVCHKIFGEGIVQESAPPVLTVSFPDETRKIIERFLSFPPTNTL